MKGFTHLYHCDGISFRWRTLMQFGNSCDIIGTVVMKNPGTAAPIARVECPQIIENSSKFDNSDTPWFEFSADSTMNCVSELMLLGKNKETSINIRNNFKNNAYND